MSLPHDSPWTGEPTKGPRHTPSGMCPQHRWAWLTNPQNVHSAKRSPFSEPFSMLMTVPLEMRIGPLHCMRGVVGRLKHLAFPAGGAESMENECPCVCKATVTVVFSKTWATASSP